MEIKGVEFNKHFFTDITCVANRLSNTLSRVTLDTRILSRSSFCLVKISSIESTKTFRLRLVRSSAAALDCFTSVLIFAKYSFADSVGASLF